ncbi:GEVED domain-containing protein [Planctomycetota bacterium]
MRKLKSNLLLFCVFLLFGAIATQALDVPPPPVAVFDKVPTGQIPDLEQKRDYEMPLDGNPEQKWCAPTAAADSVWYYGKGAYPNLIPAVGGDIANADALIQTLGSPPFMNTSDAAGGTQVFMAVSGLWGYYNSIYPATFNAQLFTAYNLPDAVGAPSAQNLWNMMTNNLYDCNDVLPIIQFGGNPPTSHDQIEYDLYIDTANSHLVMMVAYDDTDPNMDIYDPDNNNPQGHAFPPMAPANPDPTNLSISTLPGNVISLNADGVSAPWIVGAIISGPIATQQADREYGDAPEGALAYPSSGVSGSFPTCKNVAVAGYIEHNNFGAQFGPSFDFEPEGNAGLCPTFNPSTYDQDECFQDGDAGLIMPPAYTIQGPVGSETVVSCAGMTGFLGQTCATAVWGTDIDIDVTNNMPSNTTGYVNVLVDWNQDGTWSGSSNCPTGAVPEHVLVDFAVPNGYSGALSALMAAGSSFTIGPNQGYVWVRFSITEVPVGIVWDGTGVFEDGETEDYLLEIDHSGGPVPGKPLEPHTKWSQPPIEKDPTAEMPTYCGWDERSFIDISQGPTLTKMVADDYRCIGPMPITSIHWWGSFWDWEYPGPPPGNSIPAGWHIAFWSNVPANVDSTYSHPSVLLHEVLIQSTRVTMEEVGRDEYFGYFPNDTCYQFNVTLDPNEYFWQTINNDVTTNDIYWISITAMYLNDLSIDHAWGWKTRPWHWMDDAVTMDLPGLPAPQPPMPWLGAGMQLDVALIDPLVDPVFLESMDVSFELDTDPNYIKWEQLYTGIRHWPHYEDVVSMQKPGQGEPNLVQLVADDWLCKRQTPVIAISWWGSYIGYTYQACQDTTFAALPVQPDRFELKIWTDVPAGADPLYPGMSHPNEVIWNYVTNKYNEVFVGFDKHPNHGDMNEPVFRYSVKLPEDEWFCQNDANGVYWLSVTAVYDINTPNYDWGWTNHEHVFNDNAVAGQLSADGTTWTWQELYDQTDANEDMSFILFTDPNTICCDCWGDVSSGATPPGQKDNAVSLSDVFYIYDLIKNYPGTGYVAQLSDPNAAGYECADVSSGATPAGQQDLAISLSDVFHIYSHIKNYPHTGYVGPCMVKDANGHIQPVPYP